MGFLRLPIGRRARREYSAHRAGGFSQSGPRPASARLDLPDSSVYGSPPMETVLSGIQPSGGFHIGNYLGAVQNWVRLSETPGYRCFYCIVDLHAITQDYDPREMSPRVVEMTADLIACGLDPARATVF